MATPKVNWQWSIGSIVQIAVFIFALGVNWTTTNARVSTNTEAIKEAAVQRSGMEIRVRTIETSYARADERMSSIFALLSRIDARLERIEQGR